MIETDKLVDALRRIIEISERSPFSSIGVVINDCCKEARAALAEYDAQPAQAAQPVGAPDIQTIRGAIDRAWRSPNNAIKVIAPGLAEAIAQEMHAMLAAAQPAQPSADAARLDWIEAHPRLSTIVVNGQSRDCYFYGVAGASGLKLREIIDAARAAEANGNGE